MVKRIVFFLLIVACFTAFATEITLNKAEELALENDPAIKAKQVSLDLQIANSRRKLYDYGPVFHANYWQYLDRYNDDADEAGRTKSKIKLIVKQDLFKLFFVRAKVSKTEKLKADVLKAELEMIKNEVLKEVRADFFDIIRLKSKYENEKIISDLYEKIYQVAKRKYYFGEIFNNEYMEAKNAYDEVYRANQINLVNLKERKLNFAQKYNLDYKTISFVEPTVWHDLPTKNDLHNKAIKTSPFFISLAAERNKNLNEVEKDANSSISLQAYGAYNIWQNNDNRQIYAPEIGAQFSIPLFRLLAINTSFKLSNLAESQAYSDSLTAVKTIKRQLNEMHRQAYDHRLKKQKSYADLQEKTEELRILRQRILNPLSEFEVAKADTIAVVKNLAKIKQEYKDYTLKYEEDVRKIASFCGLKLSSLPILNDFDLLNTYDVKALWVWDASQYLGYSANKLVNTCKNQHINRVYLSINQSLNLGVNAAVKNLVKKLNQNNIKVYAMYAENSWLKPEKRQRLINQLDRLAIYNNSVEDDAKFYGIHLDLEPNALSLWKTNKPLALNYLVATVKQAKKSIEDSMQLDIAIFVNLDKYDDKVLDKLLKYTDSFSLMAYQKNISRLLEYCFEELVAAEKFNKKVTVGLNLKNFKNLEEYDKTVKLLTRKFVLFKSFNGFALHEYKQLQKLMR